MYISQCRENVLNYSHILIENIPLGMRSLDQPPNCTRCCHLGLGCICQDNPAGNKPLPQSISLLGPLLAGAAYP